MKVAPLRSCQNHRLLGFLSANETNLRRASERIGRRDRDNASAPQAERIAQMVGPPTKITPDPDHYGISGRYNGFYLVARDPSVDAKLEFLTSISGVTYSSFVLGASAANPSREHSSSLTTGHLRGYPYVQLGGFHGEEGSHPHDRGPSSPPPPGPWSSRRTSAMRPRLASRAILAADLAVQATTDERNESSTGTAFRPPPQFSAETKTSTIYIGVCQGSTYAEQVI